MVARRPFPALKSADSPSPPKPTSISAQVEGSGMVVVNGYGAGKGPVTLECQPRYEGSRVRRINAEIRVDPENFEFTDAAAGKIKHCPCGKLRVKHE